MGFAGYAIDYIKGPDLVLNMLCHEASINKIPIAFNNMTQQQQTDAEHAGFSVYINGPTITQIFSRYGITSSKSQGIRSANMFKMQGIDRERKSELERSINQSKHELNEVKEERQSYKTRMNELRIEKQQLEAEKGLIEAEKKKKRDAETDYKKAAGRLKSFEQELENKKRQAASYKDVAAELNAKAHELACVKAQESLRYAVCARYSSFRQTDTDVE